MSEKTILVIDDSATIRRLVDNELGSAGYRVVMAATAEDGVMMAMEELPDLILLDHQLPGTTGYDVCCQLVDDPQLKLIPVVVSSTLRNKAYAEYTEQSNVIDMLPKPYTPDLLRMTVANALDTASMVVHSQASGTAVPEVIDEMADGDLAGSFKSFGLRELLDFLNNASKQGMLEIDLARSRVAIFMSNGRIQAVTASGIDSSLIADRLPPAITDLAPMVKFTMRGRNCSEVDGLVELLDNKVLDARLLKQLLRHQAAILINYCWENERTSFRFEAQKAPPTLYSKLPLDTSLLALMVDASLVANHNEPADHEQQNVAYVRSPQRGQNLDRAGLAAQHMKLLNMVSTPMTIEQLRQKSDLTPVEIHRVLQGFVHAELVSRQEKRDLHTIIAVTSDTVRAQRLADGFRACTDDVCGKVVRDLLAVKLLLRRVRPNLFLFDLDDKTTHEALQTLRATPPAELADTKWLGIASDPATISQPLIQCLDQTVPWPEQDVDLKQLFQFGSPTNQSESSETVELADCT